MTAKRDKKVHRIIKKSVRLNDQEYKTVLDYMAKKEIKMMSPLLRTALMEYIIANP